MHYTDLLCVFSKQASLFAVNKALVLMACGTCTFLPNLLTKRYDKLAYKLMKIDGLFSSRKKPDRYCGHVPKEKLI